LKQIDQQLETLFNSTKEAFENRSFEEIGNLLRNKQNLFNMVAEKIQKQVARTRTEESSPKNTTLYFSLLLETKDLLKSTMNLMESYYHEHDDSVEPAKIEE
jgi:hypothetical protein